MFLVQLQSQGPLMLEKEKSSAVSRYTAVKLNMLGKGSSQRYFTAISERSLKPHDDCTFQKDDC